MSRKVAHETVAAILLALLAQPATAAPRAGDSTTDTAELVGTRWGRTAKGATRIVFQVDRPVEYLTVEMAQDNGFEVHLLKTAAAPLPETMSVGSGGIDRVTFRPGPSGIVARILGGPTRLVARTFRLDGPPRVVVDMTADRGTSVPAPSRTTPLPGIAKTKPALTDAAPSPAPSPEIEAPADVASATPGSGAAEPASDEAFDDLLAWITGLKRDATALQLSETEPDRVRYRRSLAFLLAKRGMANEAEKMLSSALSSDSYDAASAFADSAYLAELRLETGNTEGASEIAQVLSAAERAPAERLRLARVLAKCDFPDLVRAHLEKALPRLTGIPRIEGQLLMARAYWDRKNVGKARSYVAKLTASKHVPDEWMGPALILEADCAWATHRMDDAEHLYRKALTHGLEDEEASWVTLQLGNLANRSGRVADAIDHYRHARDSWPETFYGAQADWFLRVAEQTERLEGAQVVRGRG